MNVGNECHNNTSGDRGRGRKGWSNTPKQIPDDIKIQEQPWQDQTAWNFPYFMKLTIDQVDFNLVLTLLMGPVITTCHSIEEKAIDNNIILLYGCVSQGLGTTKFTNLIGWNRYWPRSRFSHLNQHLDRSCCNSCPQMLRTKYTKKLACSWY